MEEINHNITVDENAIITLYMEDVLENGKDPLNVFSFCKTHTIEEKNFYQYFASLQAIKERIWVKFIENVQTIINDNSEFDSYSDKDKMLTFFFSIFELFNLNRSYIAFTLESEKIQFKNALQLKEFRKIFKKIIEDKIESPIKNEKVANYTNTVFSEGAWLQFLFILKFWLDDTSSNFEKTDILIEKSITTSSLFLESKPLESLFDLAKFLLKEKM